MRKIAVYGVHKGACLCPKGNNCPSPGKHPIGNWRTDTIEPGPFDNVGMAISDGVWVLDVDAREGKDGLAELARLEEEYGALPETLTAITGSGGRHYWFLGSGVRNSVNKVGKGIDVRGDGGFVVIPPSKHASGGEYKWLNLGAEVAEAPSWLMDLVLGARKTDEAAKVSEEEANDARAKVPAQMRLHRAIAYAETMPPAVQGEGGDSATFQVARVGYQFGVDEDTWFRWMLNEFNPKCKPEWRKDELRAKVTNAYTYTTDTVFGEKLAGVAPRKKDDEEEDGAIYYVLEAMADYNIAEAWLNYTDRELLSVGGGLYVFETGCWLPVSRKTLIDWIVDEIHGATADVAGKFKTISLSTSKAEAIANAIVQRASGMGLEEFDRLYWPGVATPEGSWVVDESGEIKLLPHNRQLPVAQYLDVEINKAKACKSWQEFLLGLFRDAPDSEAVVDFLQEFLGVAMCGMSTDFAKSVWLLGFGSNGKSTLLALISDFLFDPAKVTHISPHEWLDKFSLIGLRGSLLNVASEVESKHFFGSAAIKGVIGGDTVQARHLHQDFVQFTPRAGHIFATNEMPTVPDGSHGFWRRNVVLEMRRVFETDAGAKASLLARLEKERAGIVKWALEGAARAIRRGDFEVPQSASDSTDEWRREANPIADFAASCLVQGGSALLVDIHKTYRDWYFDQSGGEFPKIHPRTLSKRISSLGFPSKRVTRGKVFEVTIKDKEAWEG